MDRSLTKGVLAGLAVALILVASLTKLWYSLSVGRGFEVSVGLKKLEICSLDDGERECKTTTLRQTILRSDRDDDKPGKGKTFVLFGEISFIVSFISAAAAALVGLFAFSKKELPRQASLALAVVIGLFALSSLVFVASKPGNDDGEDGPDLSLGLGFFMALGGAGAGVAAALLPLRPGAPGAAYPGYGGAPYGAGYGAPQPPGPPCPTCHGPLRHIPEYQRWYCDRCQRYA